MVVEVHPMDMVTGLLTLIEQDYLTVRHDQYYGKDSDMLCTVITNLLRHYLLDSPLSNRYIQLDLTEQLIAELDLFKTLLIRRTGIFEDQLPELVHDIIISPRIIGVIVIIKE